MPDYPCLNRSRGLLCRLSRALHTSNIVLLHRSYTHRCRAGLVEITMHESGPAVTIRVQKEAASQDQHPGTVSCHFRQRSDAETYVDLCYDRRSFKSGLLLCQSHLTHLSL
jgi:hypothetical protein